MGGFASVALNNPLQPRRSTSTALPSLSGGGGGMTQMTSMYGAPPATPATPAGTGTPAPAAPAALTNTAQANPDVQSFLDQYRKRLEQQSGREATPDPNLQTQVDRLGQRLSTNTTQRAIDVANSDVKARTGAANEALTTDLARRGVLGTGAEAQLRQRITEAGQRESARNAANISLGRERDLDALTLGGQGIMAAPGQYQLQREGMTNATLGAGADLARTGAQLAQGDRSLALNQWQTQQQTAMQQAELAQRQRDQELAQYMTMMRALSPEMA